MEASSATYTTGGDQGPGLGEITTLHDEEEIYTEEVKKKHLTNPTLRFNGRLPLQEKFAQDELGSWM